jgi:hypothetical protein
MFGYEYIADCSYCNYDKIHSLESIQSFIDELCQRTYMTKMGPPHHHYLVADRKVGAATAPTLLTIIIGVKALVMEFHGSINQHSTTTLLYNAYLRLVHLRSSVALSTLEKRSYLETTTLS